MIRCLSSIYKVLSPTPTPEEQNSHKACSFSPMNTMPAICNNLFLKLLVLAPRTVRGWSDALIGNLPVNTEGPVPQLVLDQSIKMLVANELERRGRASSLPADRLSVDVKMISHKQASLSLII